MNRKNKGGFTLVEVLVAMLIFLIIVFPFLSSYIMSGKMNRQSFYMKRAIEVVDMAGSDIANWDYDILESICQKDGNNIEWKYLNTAGELSMYQAFRQLLDDDEKGELDVKGKLWGDNLDVYFKVEKEGDEDFLQVEDDDLRKGYDLCIRVEDKLRMNDIVVNDRNDNNGGRGYYVKVILNNRSYECKVYKIPDGYTPLEKVDTDKKILFGGREWKKLFLPSSGDVALIYCPSSSSYGLEFPFDKEEVTPVFKRGDQSTTWGNIASYLNNEFYNSLVYNTWVDGENYYTDKNWIKKHTWNIGEYNNEASDTTIENVGLLSYSELSMIKSSVYSDLTSGRVDSYTLTPFGSKVRTVLGNVVSPTTILGVYPVIYLDKDLYCYESALNCKLYDGTSSKLKKYGSPVREIRGNKSQMTMMVYFDKNLGEETSDCFEKLRLLIDVEDKRSTKTNNGLVISAINNKKVGNYSWLNVIDATKRLGEGNENYRGFGVVDGIYLDHDYKEGNSDSNLKKVFSVNGYKVTVWAEYLNPDEYRGEDEYLNEHEKVEIHINKEKDRPTFYYKSINDSNYEEVNNIRDVDDILEQHDKNNVSRNR